MSQVEFLSPGWLALFRAYVAEGLDGLDLSGIEFGLYELYKNAPEHLRQGGRSEIFFGFRISGGRVEFPDTPWEGATIKITADYAAMAPWVTLPLEQSRAIGVGERLAKAGALWVEGDLRSRPEIMRRLNLHDRMALVTKPYETPPYWERAS